MTTTATGTAPAEVKPEPWPIANAIACLKEVRDRKTGDEERDSQKYLAMEYAIEVVKGINSLREPQPPDPAEMARRAVRDFAREVGNALQNLGYAFERIADGDIPEDWADR